MQTPPFPDNLRTAKLCRISLAKLQIDDDIETARLFQACIDHGCFILDFNDEAAKPLSDVEHAFSVAKTFFDEPHEIKIKFPMDHNFIGYKSPGTFKLADGSPDEVEYYSLGKDRIFDVSDSQTAATFLDNRDFFQKFISTRLHPTCKLILKAIATHLEISVATMDDLHDDAAPSRTMLRAIHYPPAASEAEAANGKAKFLGHTDNGSLTLLFTALGGLQMLPPSAEEHDDAAWEWVKPEPGCAFVNIGDSLVEWSGGILRAMYHRVVHCPGAQATLHRYSLGYFLKPADTASMAPIREGLVPRSDNEGDATLPYDSWHALKNKGIYKGVNGRNRGGNVSIQWKGQSLIDGSR